ncbi:MAG: hypothetical protein H8K08_08175 [Nitrospira sp.]|nr:hypothetical protein [Nitrospira sp.]
MIPFVAMVLFGCLALGALVVDLGLVVLTQGQMQTVADAAAIEGLRLRDASDLNGQPIGDVGRRQAAVQMAALVFDDDLDPLATLTQPLLQLGAGPNLTLSDGITDLNASQLISFPDQRTYQPVLELNVANQVHGDLVAGTFTPPVPAAPPIEGNAYVRNDFTPSDQAGSAVASAFLVRLRRTNDFDGLDNQGGISSSGTALPLLLGHGSMTPLEHPLNPYGYNFRQHGFTVRATAVADARPALRVGLPQPATATLPPLAGATPFALDQVFWAALSEGTPVAATVDAAGTVSSGAVAVAGRFTPPPPIPPALPDPAVLTTVGQMVVPAAPVLAAPVTGYVPIYQIVTEGGLPVERVIGFGHVSVTGAVPALQMTKLPTVIAPGNASRHLGQIPALPDPTVWPQIVAANTASLAAAGTVLTPALVR